MIGLGEHTDVPGAQSQSVSGGHLDVLQYVAKRGWHLYPCGQSG